ncbi:hypothetical protein FB474_1253 [Oryzihumus leptocrescens]|uniref:Uncharacterized protein n=1 Tax=Oryzihumus leptocrescens TaxID=297536 RepID=A0A542ZHN7_9MICO|nr:hypothetical protein FB474_1253 [Oryzihumus leptocrescens]
MAIASSWLAVPFRLAAGRALRAGAKVPALAAWAGPARGSLDPAGGADRPPRPDIGAGYPSPPLRDRSHDLASFCLASASTLP